ncbi:MAG: LicD family protein [Bacillota bacterium]|nr:LicD family protein [Bacillota bacterium]
MDNENLYGTKAVQVDLLEMMSYLHSFCKEHDIKYTLGGGSLIGVVRHGGFIPWDDDIDLMFERKEYDKFVTLFEQYGDKQYKIIKNIWLSCVTFLENVKHNKIENMTRCVDLFVFDDVPKGTATRRFKIFFLRLLQGMIKDKPEYQSYGFAGKILSFATWAFGRLFTKKFKLKIYNRISQWGESGSGFITIYNDSFKNLKIIHSSTILESYSEMPFDGLMLYVMSGAHRYLETRYGDYMKLPPIEQRIPQHI